MICKREPCKVKEDRIEGYCSVYCRDVDLLQKEVDRLELEAMKSIGVHALEIASRVEKDSSKMLNRAEEIVEFLIKSGDELHYAYSTEELLKELIRREEGYPAEFVVKRFGPHTEFRFEIGDKGNVACLVLANSELENLEVSDE